LGSFFGHLYLLGGNLSEVVISGRIAGKDAATQVPWDGEAEVETRMTA
jgi:succinate dehydrogenase/fumarate reductase flavoprotein subunit